MKRISSLLFVLVLLTACQPTKEESTLFNDVVENSVPDDWAMIDVGDFTLYAPAAWEYVPEQGIDSMIGKIEGDGISLEFDYGMYSGFLDTGTESNYDIVEDTITGFDAKIATPKITGEGLTMVFFEEVRDGQQEITPVRAAGTFKLWLRDGMVSKYQVRLHGVLTVDTPNGRRHIEVRQSADTVLKDVGTTKFDVPPQARAKLER